QRDFLHALHVGGGGAFLLLRRLRRWEAILHHLLVAAIFLRSLRLLHRSSGDGGEGGGVGGRWRGIRLHPHRSGGDGGGGFLHPLFSSLHLLLALEAPPSIVLETPFSILPVEFGQILADDRFGN